MSNFTIEKITSALTAPIENQQNKVNEMLDAADKDMSSQDLLKITAATHRMEMAQELESTLIKKTKDVFDFVLRNM